MLKLIRKASVLAVVALGFMATQVNAASLGLVSKPPDVLSNFVSLSYNGTNTFTASGIATQLTLPGNIVTPIAGGGTFSLTAQFTISGSGSTATLNPTSGSLSVTGNGGAPIYFASSNLLAIGFSTNPGNPGGATSNQVFEFVFGPGTGLYGSAGQIGVILASTVNTPYHTTFFGAGFNNTGFASSATADTFTNAVPLPKAAYMGLTALAMAAVVLRRRRVQTATA